MKRLYVRFAGDNQYILTIMAFVQAIAPRILDGGRWENITKDQIVMLFNRHAYSLYELHQSREILMEEKRIYQGETLRSYLKIETKDIYFDEDVDEFANFNQDGCLASLENNQIKYYVM